MQIRATAFDDWETSLPFSQPGNSCIFRQATSSTAIIAEIISLPGVLPANPPEGIARNSPESSRSSVTSTPSTSTRNRCPYRQACTLAEKTRSSPRISTGISTVLFLVPKLNIHRLAAAPNGKTEIHEKTHLVVGWMRWLWRVRCRVSKAGSVFKGTSEKTGQDRDLKGFDCRISGTSLSIYDVKMQRLWLRANLLATPFARLISKLSAC